MSSVLGVYFASDRLPSLGDWERAAAELGVRLRLMPVELRGHSGMLPVAFEADDYNTGFEFALRHDWGRDERLDHLLRGKDCFACFRCFGPEFQATVWAAVSFAKASGGVFRGERGETYPTLEDALEFARGLPVHGPQFFFEGELVGLFLGAEGPRSPGRHEFEPRFGRGYSRMSAIQGNDGSLRCYYDRPGERVWFTVTGRPYSDVLELDDFEITRLGDGPDGPPRGEARE